MNSSNGNALIATVLATACLLVVGGLVAWGAGYLHQEPAPATMPPPAADGAHGGAMNLPAGHPPIGDMTASPGPVRADAPAGACPVSKPAAATAEKTAAGDSCCPEPEKKKECSGEDCPGDGSCEACKGSEAN